VLIFGLWWLYFLQPTGDGLAAKRDGAFFWGYGHYFMFAALGALGAGLEVVVKLAGGHGGVPAAVAAFSVAIPVAVYLLAIVVTNARILPGIAVHFWIVIPAAILVLLIAAAAGTLGLPLSFGLTALLVAFVVVATMVLGRRRTRKANA
jgi:low temperature requirement protein LtrA